MTARLTKDGKKHLRRSSRESIEGHFQAFSAHDRKRKWVHRNNRYRLRCAKRYEDDVEAKPPKVDHSALTTYMAASGPCHVIDGWSFIGRAIDATLRGD